jgi:hypothetical protein
MFGFMREPAGEPWLTVAGLAKRVVLLGRGLRPVRVPLHTAEGEIVYAGEGESLTWLARLHGARLGERHPLDWPGLRDLACQRKNLIYVEVNRLLRPLLPAGAFFTLPWISYVADPRQAQQKLIEDIYGRKVRQQGFSFRWQSGDAVARSFYRDLYLPYVRWRFGSEAHARGQDEILSAVREGLVLQVLDKDQVVAAAVCRVRGDTLICLALGLASDFAGLLRRGAVSAIYYEVFRWAREHGMHQVNLLRSRPHARDGTVLHKRRFAGRPVLDPWPHALLAVYPPLGLPLPETTKDLLVESGHGSFVTLATRLQSNP